MTIAMLRKCYGQRHVNVLNGIKVAVRYWDSEKQKILNFQWDRHCTFKTIHEGTVKVQTSTEVGSGQNYIVFKLRYIES